MARQWVDLEERTFLVINFPLVSLGLAANVFYLFCLCSPLSDRAKLKQPLKILLEFLIWTCIVFLLFFFCMYMVMKHSKSQLVRFVLRSLVLCNVHSSMMTSVWLSVYYYIQIVPLQRAFFLWVKKNIKLVIYTALIYQEVLIHVFGAADCVNALVNYSTSTCNGTLLECERHLFSTTAGFYIMKLHVMGCLVMMTVSNFSTFNYLRSHMKKVAQGNVLTQKTASQLRTANAAVFQGVIYFTYCIFYLFSSFTVTFSPSHVIGTWISLTFTTLYIFGTTINMGIGQTLFRQRVAGVWRALAVHCSVDTPTND